jgi:predicted nucleic acid-binding protein
VSVYVDASVLVALFTDDALAIRADAFLRSHAPVLIVSDFAAAEFSSASARHVRMKALRPEDARHAFATFNAWAVRSRPLPTAHKVRR